MGLFDSIRNAVGGSDDGSGDDGATLLDSTTLDPTDFRERAERVADAEGLDFSLASLDQLDTLVATLDDRETADDATAATTYTEQTVDFGSYLGEVLVRAYDGDWASDEGWGVTVTGPDDEVTVSVFEVAVRSLESDPVFAAVVERLRAELALDAVDADAPVESGDGEPDASEDLDTADASARDDEIDADAGDLTVDAFRSKDADDGSETAAADDETGPGPVADSETAGDAPTDDADDLQTDDAEAVDSPADLIAEAEPGVEDAETEATEETDTGPEVSDIAGDTEDGSDETPESPPDLTVSDDVEETAETASDPEPDSTAQGTEEESEASSDGSPADTDEVAVGTTDDEDSTDDQPLTDEAAETDPTAGDGLRAEYAETAQEFTDFWSERDLDYSADSLTRLDDLVDGEWEANRFRDATFGSEADFDDRAFTSIVTELGSYFGEVLVRDLDGEWTDETDHVGAVVVPTDDGALAVPVFQVAMNSLRKTAVFERSYDALLEDIGR